MEQQIPPGGKQSFPQRVESEQTDGRQQQDSSNRPKVGNEIQDGYQQSPQRGIGHAQEIEPSAHEGPQTKVDQGNREQVIGNVLLNLMADLDRALLIAERRHDPNQL